MVQSKVSKTLPGSIWKKCTADAALCKWSFLDLITIWEYTPDYRFAVPSYWTLISVYVCELMESALIPQFSGTTQLIITFRMFIQTPVRTDRMTACANCNRAWVILNQGLIICEITGLLLCFLFLTVLYFLWTKDWISGEHFDALDKLFFVSSEKCRESWLLNGECRCVLLCLEENGKVFFFCWLILLSLFTLIHLEELYKNDLYTNPKSPFNIISFLCYS